MSLRLLVGTACVVLTPVLLAAQHPSAELMTAYSVGWNHDSSRSDPPVAGIPMPQATVLVPRDSTIGAGPPAGGGGRRGGGGGAAGGTRPAGLPPGGRGGNPRMMRNPFVRELIAQLNTPPSFVLTTTAEQVAIATPDGTVVTWTPDGKKHQKAMVDGSILEFTATWKGDKLELRDGVASMAELRREFKLSRDGETLELKLDLSGPGIPKKLSRKVVYTREG